MSFLRRYLVPFCVLSWPLNAASLQTVVPAVPASPRIPANRVSLTDFGVQKFDIRNVPDVDVNRDLKDRKPGGLGIHLLKRMVDDVGYEFVDGRSTTTFVKALE